GGPVSFDPSPSFDNSYLHRARRRSLWSHYGCCVNALDKPDKGGQSRDQAAQDPGIHPYFEEPWKIKMLDSYKTHFTPFNSPDIAWHYFDVSSCYSARSFGHIPWIWAFPSRTGNWYHFIRVYEIPFRRILVACIFPRVI